jgi:hypothetical protein
LILDKYLENKHTKKENIHTKLLLILQEKAIISNSFSIGKRWCEYLIQNKSLDKLYAKGVLNCANLHFESKDFSKARNLIDSINLDEITNKSIKKQIILLSISLSSNEKEFKTKIKDFSKKFSKPSDREKLLAIGKEFYQQEGNLKKFKKLHKWMKQEFPETHFQ